MRGHRDLRLVVWGAVACAVLGLLVPLTALSLLFAAPLTLLLPGYAIAVAIFAERRLDRSHLLPLSLALSLITLVLGGLLLNYLPGGLAPLPWALLLTLVTLGACRLAALRRAPGTARGAWRPPRVARRDAWLAAGGLLLGVAAIVLAMTTLPASNARGYTQLWLLPAPGSRHTEAKVGVRSDEQRATRFDLRVKIGAAGATPQVIHRSFELAPGEARVIRVGPAAGATGAAVPVTAILLRHDQPYKIYRRVRGWLTAPGELP
jgi:hypothetical protein